MTTIVQPRKEPKKAMVLIACFSPRGFAQVLEWIREKEKLHIELAHDFTEARTKAASQCFDAVVLNADKIDHKKILNVHEIQGSNNRRTFAVHGGNGKRKRIPGAPFGLDFIHVQEIAEYLSRVSNAIAST